jgi:NRAMP (natural resistance-associated macrophage protein)-like metal ion transporter
MHPILSYCRRFAKAIGPGVITGAADDDPSGIATYSVAGAQFGTSMLWTALLTWPLMGPVQMMCARIGMVTGAGLACALKEKFPRPLVILAAFALLFANTLNVGSDLAGMADAAEMLSGLSFHIYVALFALAISWATIRLRYVQIARSLMWLALFLFSYVIAGFHIRPQWTQVARDALIPSIPHGKQAWAMLVAILGTTISPYLFFWQAAQEVEHDKAEGRDTIAKRLGATGEEIIDRKFDVGLGTFFSNLVMFFIILTTALTLHRHGITELENSRQVAEALKPLAGNFAYLLYTIGLLGVGFLAIPTLTGSAAYAFADIFKWRQGLDERPRRAQAFYGVMVVSTLLAVVINFLKVNPLKALYWTAVVNGILAPFLLVGILAVASDRTIMRGQSSSWLGRIAVGIVTIAMFAAAVLMFVTS